MQSFISPSLNFWYATMSKYPVPVRPNTMVFASPVSRHFSASSMAARIAWLLSGANLNMIYPMGKDIPIIPRMKDNIIVLMSTE